MNHIYFGLTLSLICLFLLYFILPTFLLVTVLCVILAGLYFKDDYVLSRYVATHVASIYSWICEFSLSIQNMYHQSNNTNFPIRRSVENNGALSRKFDRLHHGSSSYYNLSTPLAIDNTPINSGRPMWDSGSKFSSPVNSFSNRTHTTLQDMSKLKISHQTTRGNNVGLMSDRFNSNAYNTSSLSPITIARPNARYSNNADKQESELSHFLSSRDQPSNNENNPPVNAKLYADVSSPGFCGRVADQLREENVTHQSKYDTVGAFPVVNFKSQSPKIKIKPPVRVRLAPPSNELMHYNYGANTFTRSPVAVGPEESMKSVLQVLKEISRKRIHSHVDEDSEEVAKRLRVTDTPLDNDGLLHTSLLQQTIQGKRAREESSPNEDDKKRRKASLKNNEILSSLSSSISIRPPHLQTAKRKAQNIDDSITSTPVTGKLPKVQAEVTPPKPTNHIAAPDAIVPDVSKPAVQEVTVRTSSPVSTVPSPIVPPPTVAVTETPKPPVPEPPAVVTQPEEEGTVSRLLGRLSDQTKVSRPVDIPGINGKKNAFMSTNDLSLSPPKENRLAAMIAVLGGPSEQSELENIQSDDTKQPERLIKGKALFMTPETPTTPDSLKQNKKVTFSDSLTTTKIFERDEPDKRSSTAVSSNSLALTSTPLSSITAPVNSPSTLPKFNSTSDNANVAKPFALNFASSPLSSSKESPKTNESINFTSKGPPSTGPGNISSPAKQTSPFQMQSPGQSLTAPSSSAGSTFSGSSSVVGGSSANAPASGFSFGTNNPLINPNKNSLSKQTSDSSAVKTFSFGSESKTSQPAAASFTSLFSSATPKTETVKATDTGSIDENKPMFNIFGNKDNLSSASKTEGQNKPLVNGFAPVSSNSSPFALTQPVGQGNTSKQPGFGLNSNPTTSAQSASPFSFGSATALTTSSAALTTQQTTLSAITSTTQQSNSANAVSFQPNSQLNAATSASLNIFNSNSTAQSKPGAFGSGTQGTPSFGDNMFKPLSSNNQTSAFGNTPSQSLGFGSNPSQPTAFGSSPALQNGAVSSTSGTTQSSNMFGNISSNANKPITFGGGTTSSTQQTSKPMFGFTGTTDSTQASSPFGITLNNSTSNTPTMFGNTTTAQSTPVFGSTSNTGSQSNTFPSSTSGQSSLFGSASNDASKNLFAGANTAPAFGGAGNAPSPFGQTNSTPTFGQNTTAAPTFGNQSTPSFSFGSQNNAANPTGGFVAPTFGANSNNSSTNEVKPPAFGGGSPFMFGSSASKPTEAVKPLGTAAPFAFGSNAQLSSSSNPSQPSAPTFGAPAPTFGASQPAPTFGGGTPQPAAPTFQFGQGASSAPAPAFQFNAAPPTAGGGMFSIGSGGSSTSRPKTTVLRRNHKRP